MTLLEIMELSGIDKPELAKVYVRDGLRELQQIIPEKTTSIKIDVVANQKFYSLPGNHVKVLEVYRKYDDKGRYIRIEPLLEYGILDEGSSTSVAASDNLNIVDEIVVV